MFYSKFFTILLAFAFSTFGCSSDGTSKTEATAQSKTQKPAENTTTEANNSEIVAVANSICECLKQPDAAAQGECEKKVQPQLDKLGIENQMLSRPLMQELGKCIDAAAFAKEVTTACDCVISNFAGDLEAAQNKCTKEFEAMATKASESGQGNMVMLPFIGCLAKDQKTYESFTNSIKTMQLKAKRAEAPTQVKSLKVALIQYQMEKDTLLECAEFPPRSPGKLRPWVTQDSGNFKTLNYQPDSDIRGSYSVKKVGADDFLITGVIDADGDGVFATYTATKTTNPTAPTNGQDVY